MKNFRVNSSHHGFTLIELMIAMLIGVFLMAGVIQIFLSAKQAYRLQENLSRLQENGRFAMDFITKDIRMAGFMGCASKSPAANIKNMGILGSGNTNPDPAAIDAITTGIFGRDVAANNWNTIACGAANECIPNTDAISFQSANSCGGQLTATSTATDVQISATNTCGIAKYDVVLIANCKPADPNASPNADFFVATNSNPVTPPILHASSDNNPTTLSTTYGVDAELFDPRLVSYYIRTSVGGGVNSLWVVDNTKKVIASTNPSELIEGIENMQVLYGIDTDATPDYVANSYISASSIPFTISGKVYDWSKVVSIRITLLAVTIEDNLTDAPQSYVYNGTPMTPTDLRLRRVFSSTIAVRNRLR
jgi:type IV pilus assembly protein PilW